MNSLQTMRSFEKLGINITYEALNQNYGGYVYVLGKGQDLTCLGVVIDNGKIRAGFTVCHELINPYDSIFCYLLMTERGTSFVSHFLSSEELSELRYEFIK